MSQTPHATRQARKRLTAPNMNVPLVHAPFLPSLHPRFALSYLPIQTQHVDHHVRKPHSISNLNALPAPALSPRNSHSRFGWTSTSQTPDASRQARKPQTQPHANDPHISTPSLP